MAKSFVKNLLRKQLGQYLEGLDQTEVTYGLSEASLVMKNVSVKEDALKKLKLPVQIKHGVVQRLDVRVPWRHISSSPVDITFEGVELLLTPMSPETWEFQDIFSEDYLQKQLQQLIAEATDKSQTEEQQGYFSQIKLKVLDNLKVKVKNVHIRVEHYISGIKLQSEANQSSFGILMRTFEIQTTDRDGNEVFHDRKKQASSSVFKKICLEGLAVYLNPFDPVMIHKRIMHTLKRQEETSILMQGCIQSYLDLTSVVQSDQLQQQKDSPNLIYILRPLSLRVFACRKTEKPEKMAVEIALNQFSLQFQYNQLKSILVFAKLAEKYSSRLNEQEKIRKYRFLKSPKMTVIQKWQFAINSIIRSIRVKNGALTAFQIAPSKLLQYENTFKPLLFQYYTAVNDKEREILLKNTWQPESKELFWHILSAINLPTAKKWCREIILPIIKAKKDQESKTKQKSGWFSWGSKQDNEDNLQEFFDVGQFESEEELTNWQRTQLEVLFEVKELTLLLAKQQKQKLEGIQMYNKGAMVEFKAPTMLFDQYTMEVTFQESGVNLVTLDTETGIFQDCTAAIEQNKQEVIREGQQVRPQLVVEIKKGQKELLKDSIEFDVNIQLGSIIYKYYEDLMIRAKAIANVQLDQKIQTAALDTLEDLQRQTQNRMYEIINKNKIRYSLSLESPIIILPIHQTFEGKKAAVWILKTGNVKVESEDLTKRLKNEKKTIFYNGLTEDEVYDGYNIEWSNIGLRYFKSYDLYEKSIQEQKLKRQKAFEAGQYDVLLRPQTFTHGINQNEHVQSSQEFVVLEEFEVNMFLKTLRSKTDPEARIPRIDVQVEQSPIVINYNHLTYNHLINIFRVFEISKQKQELFLQQEEIVLQNKKQEISADMVMEGMIQRLVPQTRQFEQFFCVLSGRYLYLYTDRNAQTYADFLEIRSATVSETDSLVTIIKEQRQWTFKSVEKQDWCVVLKKHISKMYHLDFNNTQNLDKQMQKRIQDIKKKKNNPEQISVKMHLEMSSMKVNFLQIQVDPATNIPRQPIVYTDWVCIELQKMKMTQVQRQFDTEQIIKFGQITLIDKTVPKCHETLIYQDVDVNEEYSMEVSINKIQEKSSKFKGCLYEAGIALKNVNFKFMPGSINQVLKLLRSTKYQGKPFNYLKEKDLLGGQRYVFYDEDDENQSPSKLLEPAQLDHLSNIALLPEQKAIVQDNRQTQVVQKVYSSSCSKNKIIASKYTFSATKIDFTMLHHRYAMELYSLKSAQQKIVMEDAYDHFKFSCQMTDMILSDLTNHPYTRSPVRFFEIAKKNGEQKAIQPKEMITCRDFAFSYTSIYSDNCALKDPRFNNVMKMRVSPFRINYVQETIFRFNEYFQQRFIDSLVMTDPYKNPKEEFEKLQNRKGLSLKEIKDTTDFKQNVKVDKMDIEIAQAEIFARGRFFDQNFILIASPLIKVESEYFAQTGRLTNSKDKRLEHVPLGFQRYKIELQTINFFYGISSKRKDWFPLMEKTFTIKVNYEYLLYSEVLEKLDVKQWDKSSNVVIEFDPIQMVIPQAIYTYMLRCSDLNFTWTDRMTQEFYCVKWVNMQDYYKNFKEVVSQRIQMHIPAFGWTLKHTDGSFITELLLTNFKYKMTKYLDGASFQDVQASNFFILDQSSRGRKKQRHAIVCPYSLPMEIDPYKQHINNQSSTNEELQLKCTMDMKASGDREIRVDITGLKIFVKMPIFILLQGYFMNSFPAYTEGDIDKPTYFKGNDPDNSTRMAMVVSIHKSLICLLNQPGYKSIAMQGEFQYKILQENTSRVKNAFDSIPKEFQEQKDLPEFTIFDKPDHLPPKNDIVYTMFFGVENLTPYICSLSHLESGDLDFQNIKKRQLFQPLSMNYLCNYQLAREQPLQNLSDKEKWGVNTHVKMQCGQLQLKMSMLDMHMILQVMSYTSEQMAKETVLRLQEIEKGIAHESDLSMSEVSDQLNDSGIAQANKQIRNKSEFNSLIQRVESGNDNTTNSVVQRLSTTTNQFKKLTQGYITQKYDERGSFMNFIRADLLNDEVVDANLGASELQTQNFKPLLKSNTEIHQRNKKVSGSILPVKIEQGSSDEGVDQDDLDPESMSNKERIMSTTEEKASYKKLMESTRDMRILKGSMVGRNSMAISSRKFDQEQQPSSGSTEPRIRADSQNGPSQFSQRNLSVMSAPRSQRERRSSSNRSHSNQSSDDDDFKSCQDDNENQRDEFYSFHEPRSNEDALKNRTSLLQPLREETVDEDELQPLRASDSQIGVPKLRNKKDVSAIRETTAELRHSDESVEGKLAPAIEAEDVDAEIKLTLEVKTSAQPGDQQELKASTHNIIDQFQEVRIEQVSILAINDYNCGFTPVLQLELAQGVEMTQDSQRSRPALMNLDLPAFAVNYYNIELGEWEPLIEPAPLHISTETLPTRSDTSIRMAEPVCINSTEECLRNLIHTYSSWMATPKFYGSSAATREKEKKRKKGRYSRVRHSRSFNSIQNGESSSSSDDDSLADHLSNKQRKKQNRQFMSQMRESLVDARPLFEQDSEDHKSSEQLTGPRFQQQKQQLVTPFSIANYTSRQIKVVRGGIKKFADVKYLTQRSLQQTQGGEGEDQKVYFLDAGEQTDYAVSYERLMGQNNREETKERTDSQELSWRSQRDEDGTQSERQTELAQENKLNKLRNAEMIGIQFSELDYVKNFDLNKNTGPNPYVHEISPDKALKRSRTSARKFGVVNTVDLEQPLIEASQNLLDETGKSGFVEVASGEDKFDLITNKVFYGTMLKGMRKFMVVRSPYCINNKTEFVYEVRIKDSVTKEIRQISRLIKGESIGLDDNYLVQHSLQLRMLKSQSDYIEQDEDWSDAVQINPLLKMPLNDGTGFYVSSFNESPITTCIKLQSGEINGTSDLVLLPAITLKNCLPCSILVRQPRMAAKSANKQVSTLLEDPTNSTIRIDQSQEKQFHLFQPTYKTDTEKMFSLEVGVDKFTWRLLELSFSDKTTPEDVDIDIKDNEGNTLRIGLRKSYQDAGFKLVLFAHVVILCETLSLLPQLQICSKQGYFQQEQPLPAQSSLAKDKFIMCNKDVDIVIGIQNRNPQQRQAYSYSPVIQVKESGTQIPFTIKSEPTPGQAQLNERKYEFVCTPNLVLANNESRIFTKVVQITPQYVICNQTDRLLEIAQSDNIQAIKERERIFQPYEKKEWYWPVGNLPQEHLKLVFRKVGNFSQISHFSSDSSYSPNSRQNKLSEVLLKRKQTEDTQPDLERRQSESDQVYDWQWSKPFSLHQMKDQSSFPILLCEQNGPRKKIYLIQKKVINYTTFIIIKEENPTAPHFIIQNNCPNIRLQFTQDQQQMPSTWKLRENQEMAYAHLDPQNRITTVSFNLTIDRSCRKWNFQPFNCFEKNFPELDLTKPFSKSFTYPDRDNNKRVVEMFLKDDGITKRLTLSLADYSSQRRLQNQKQSSAVNQDPLVVQSFTLMLHSISLSIIGYTNTTVQQQTIKKAFQQRRERNEIALITVGDLRYNSKSDNRSNMSSTNLSIQKFQVDNQTTQNPLFPTILQRKDPTQNEPFLYFVFKRTTDKEMNLDRFDHFELRIAEYVLRLDDSFLMNMSQTILKALQLNESNTQQEHPLFMIDNYYSSEGYLEIYQKLSSGQHPSHLSLPAAREDLPKTPEERSSAALTYLKKQNSRQRSKERTLGLATVSELRFTNNIESVPAHFRHWLLQTNTLEDQAKLEIVNFKINTIVMEITFIFRTTQQKNKVEGPVGFLQKSGLKVASIDELTLEFSEFVLEQKMIAKEDFSQELSNHYWNKAYNQIVKSFLTIKLLGSLPNLYRNLSQGCKEAYQDPINGFNQSWYRGVGGIGTGFIKLLKYSVIGVFGTTQVFCEAWSGVALDIGLDKDYATRHEEEVITERPKNFVEGLGFGARSALQSIPEATVGFFTRPVIEASRNGYKGFGLGLYEGIFGIPLKLISGALDLIAKTSEGVKNTCRIFDQKQKKGRVRMPRTFYGLQRKIKNYSEDDAFIVSNVLCQIKRGEFALDHFIDMKLIRTASDNNTPHFLLLSEENLFLIEASQKALVWHIEYKHITEVRNMQNGLLISLKEDQDYAGRAQVGLPLDHEMSKEINHWFEEIMDEQF